MSYKVHLDTCPFCGREDTAQLIPHGIGIAKFFIVRCVVKRGGCGASAKPYWETRIANWARRMHDGKTPVLEFQSGYGRFSPRMAFVAGDGKIVIGLPRKEAK